MLVDAGGRPVLLRHVSRLAAVHGVRPTRLPREGISSFRNGMTHGLLQAISSGTAFLSRTVNPSASSQLVRHGDGAFTELTERSRSCGSVLGDVGYGRP